MTYQEFIETKKHTSQDYGIKANFIPNQMFDFQKYITELAIRKGRFACFVDTGLGKTLIELTIAINFVKATNKPVLIITPLAVAFQFIKEAEKFGIDDISYSKDGKYKTKIVICNYERLDKFNSSDFNCVILDESSILKNFDGVTKQQITSFLKRVKYRFLASATPAPNDFIELGTSSEALGYLGYIDMLSKFFTNNNNNSIAVSRVRQANIGNEWILKEHAKISFFQWISSWAITLRKPSDLGFSDDKFVLPKLIINKHEIKNINFDSTCGFFNVPSQNFFELRKENKQTILERCTKAVELANNNKISVYWCNLNEESALLKKLDSSAKEIIGSMSIDEKEEILVAFSKKEISKLITKSSMTAFGLNWQHCNHTVYFPTFSYEQYYQSIRRFWRFGQKLPVTVDLVYSEGQIKILNSLLAKEEKANKLFSKLNKELHSEFDIKTNGFNKKIQLPKFIL